MVPKSLHTVRVLAVMAGEIQRRLVGLTAAEAVEAAAEALGYEGEADCYGLKAKAAEQLAGRPRRSGRVQADPPTC